LDSTAGTWTTTTGTSYTPATALTEGTHVLYVKERDAAGNWSATGNYSVTVDTTAPNAPVVTSAAVSTNNTKPTWTWGSGGGGGNGTFQYQLDSTGGAWTTTTGTSYTSPTALTDGAHVLYVEERDAAGNWSTSGSYTVTVDTVAPNAPVVTSAAALTNNPKPTWTWGSGGGGGNGTFEYQLDSTAGTWTTTTGTSYAPTTALTDGAHMLYVEERDTAGNWSAAGSYGVTVDTTPPNAPVVTSAATLTNNSTPTWTWGSGGGGGNGTFQYQLGSTSGVWTTTTGTSYTPTAALADGAHVLYVEERDAAGNWSASGSYSVTLDTVPPTKPTVTSAAALTNNATPAWTWTSGGGGGNGTFQYQLDSTGGVWTTTTGTSYTPTTALADGLHTLYVQERDTAGNWSVSGSYAVTVDTTPPNAPVVTAGLVTARRADWRWASGGGGNGTFEYQLDATADGGWTTTTGTRFVSADLSPGSHALYVRERDDAGNWSAIGSCSIATIDAAQDWRGYR
jgi:hypothetical protein